MWFMEWEKPSLFYLLDAVLSQVYWDKLQAPINLQVPPQPCISQYTPCTGVQSPGLCKTLDYPQVTGIMGEEKELTHR